MTLSLKTAKRVLLAAGYNASEISELVRGIKADAWDKGKANDGLWRETESGVWDFVNLYRDSEVAK